MHLTVLMNVWNSALWLPWAIRGCYAEADTIVITESCWVDGGWSDETSPDGTAAVVERFVREEDFAGKVRFHRAGRVSTQPEGRNSGLSLVPRETDWVFLVDSDEFYPPGALAGLKGLMRSTPVDLVVVPARVFYFDFTWFKREEFRRGFRWFPGQCFTKLADMQIPNGLAFTVHPSNWEMFHYAYVSPEWTRLKACMGTEVPADHYRHWWDTVYSDFDGANLEALYQRNAGGIHVLGGGTLERYGGPHPPMLDDHPLRHWRWTGRGGTGAAASDTMSLLGLSFDEAVAGDPKLRDVLQRIHVHIASGRYHLAARMVEQELRSIPQARVVLERLRATAHERTAVNG